jgi:hypothetical protein
MHGASGQTEVEVEGRIRGISRSDWLLTTVVNAVWPDLEYRFAVPVNTNLDVAYLIDGHPGN